MIVNTEPGRAMTDIVRYGKKMLEDGLASGSGGNISVFLRDSDTVLITPSGLEYTEMTENDIVVLDGDGRLRKKDALKPSSELGFHLAIYRARKDVSAVVHTHSPFATTFACLRMELPAVHYLVGFAGRSVPVTPYATFGSDELAVHVREHIRDRNAVLLANHGLVACGGDIHGAYTAALETEFTARIYHQALAVGKPFILDDEEMDRVIEKFGSYGRAGKG